jgi:hypothetical protein
VKAGLAAVLLVSVVVSGLARSAIPARLSETGLYLPGTVDVDPRNRAFSPQYPLWTDGAAKARWIHLPPGERIDARDVDRWIFPVGTRLWKEFAFNGRKVETRMIWHSGPDDWTFASYVWNDAQTDATLAPEEGMAGVADLAPGVRHDIPSREDCRACHDTGATPVLGFTALQLSSDRDPAAPHAERLRPEMVTLTTLNDERLLEPAHPDLSVRVPRIPGDPRTRAALGYLTGNCGHCHNESSSVATVRYPLLMPAYATDAQVNDIINVLVTRTTTWDVPHAAPGTSSFVKAGAPDLSALFVRMRSRRPSSQMPPLGTRTPDREGLELVTGWIEGLSKR